MQEPIFHCLSSGEADFKALRDLAHELKAVAVELRRNRLLRGFPLQDLLFHQHCFAGEQRKEAYATISMAAGPAIRLVQVAGK